METHVKIVGWLYIVLGLMGLLAGLIAFVVLLGVGVISNDQTAFSVLGLIALVTGVIVFVLSAPGVVAGIGLLSFRPWARVLALVLGVLNLPGFPFGTVLGVYTLYALLDEEANRLFTPAQV